jgi:hypothetical protein
VVFAAPVPFARRRNKALSGAVGFALAALVSAPASADPCGWATIGAGVTAWQQGTEGELQATPTMAIDFGVGSNPDGPVLVGGLMRMQPYIGYGTDLAWMGRVALGGFQSDWVGIALDAGLYQRFWGEGSTGFTGELVLAGPFGLQLTAGGTYGSGKAYGVGGTLGIDFVRLVLGRAHLLEWWPNPHPEDRLEAQSAAAAER